MAESLHIGLQKDPLATYLLPFVPSVLTCRWTNGFQRIQALLPFGVKKIQAMKWKI